MSLLEASGITVFFGGLAALRDVGFHVDRGEIVSIIGPNGAGKTTLFNVITGFLKPTRGLVCYEGNEITRLRPHQIAGLGIVRTFQKTSIFGGITVLEGVLTGRHLKARIGLLSILANRGEVAEEEGRLLTDALEIIKFTGLETYRDYLGKNLPYGDQRVLEIAVALAAEPRLLLLDEPAAGLNISETQRVMGLIGSIRERGITIILVEHDMRLVMGISDRVIALNYGEVIADGPPEMVREDPGVVKAYLGTAALGDQLPGAL